MHPPLVAFSSNDTLICDGDSAFLGAVVISGDGGPYNFNWNQGLGNNQNNYVNPSSTTTYNLNISDGCETISLNTTVTVSPIPIISFTASNLDGCLPVEVTLFDLNVPPGAQCFWDFGDGGNSSSCDSVSYLFSNPGCWDVSLNVTTPDSCFATHSESQYVCVYEYPNSTFPFLQIQPLF